MSIGIIIQARMGSTRLPSKMTLPFYENQGILDVILNKLIDARLKIPIIVATTINESDNVIEKIANSYSLNVYRGSENNVLERFIRAAEKYKIDKIIRICADNPFLDIQDLSKQIEDFQELDVDYFYYCDSNKTPSIKTSFGFWSEGVSLRALKKVNDLTKDKLYQEHVTNFIYTHPENFKLSYKYINPFIESNPNIRLTVDTKNDFDLTKNIYFQIKKEKKVFSIIEVVELVKSNKEWVEIMKSEIANNIK